MGTETGVRWRSALLEGIAVLLGILLAFAIDAAWDTHQGRQRVQAYLASLRSELEANRSLIESNLEFLQDEIAETRAYLVDVVADPRGPVSQDSIRGMVAAMGPLRNTPLQRAAFDDLASGELQSIEDGEIRRLILEYGRAMDFDAVRQQTAQNWFDTRAQPYDEAEADLVGMSAIYHEGWAGRTDVRFEIDPAAFVRNRRYGNLLAARVFRMSDLVYARTSLLDRLVELYQALDVRGVE
ncbi:MAG: hypothetical protein R3344_03010 [Acidobacteriota bacterium]|nr:hypothetical protein [Acidobacteriota bacterium]